MGERWMEGRQESYLSNIQSWYCYPIDNIIEVKQDKKKEEIIMIDLMKWIIIKSEWQAGWSNESLVCRAGIVSEGWDSMAMREGLQSQPWQNKIQEYCWTYAFLVTFPVLVQNLHHIYYFLGNYPLYHNRHHWSLKSLSFLYKIWNIRVLVLPSTLMLCSKCFAKGSWHSLLLN